MLTDATPTPQPVPLPVDPIIDSRPPQWLIDLQTWINNVVEPWIFYVLIAASLGVWLLVRRQARLRRERLAKSGKQESPSARAMRFYLLTQSSVWVLFATSVRVFGEWTQTAVTVVTLFVLIGVASLPVAGIRSYGVPAIRAWWTDRRDRDVRDTPRKSAKQYPEQPFIVIDELIDDPPD